MAVPKKRELAGEVDSRERVNRRRYVRPSEREVPSRLGSSGKSSHSTYVTDSLALALNSPPASRFELCVWGCMALSPMWA